MIQFSDRIFNASLRRARQNSSSLSTTLAEPLAMCSSATAILFGIVGGRQLSKTYMFPLQPAGRASLLISCDSPSIVRRGEVAKLSS